MAKPGWITMNMREVEQVKTIQGKLRTKPRKTLRY